MDTGESKGTSNRMLEGTLWTSFLPSGVGGVDVYSMLSLSTQVYKWVPVNQKGHLTECWRVPMWTSFLPSGVGGVDVYSMLSLSTQVYKWVLVNQKGHLTECWRVPWGLASYLVGWGE